MYHVRFDCCLFRFSSVPEFKCLDKKEILKIADVLQEVSLYKALSYGSCSVLLPSAHVCSEGSTVLGLCVCLSMTILVLQATGQFKSDTYSLRATRPRKNSDFAKITEFEIEKLHSRRPR